MSGPDEYVFSTRYHILEPGKLSSNNTQFIVTISAYVKAEDTKVNEDLTIMLRVAKYDTRKECEDWVRSESRTLSQWYLDTEVRPFLKENLSDENFQYLLDEEAELLKEPKNA